MKEGKGIFKNTIIFMLIFGLLTIFTYMALIGIVYFYSIGQIDDNYIMDENQISYKDIKWDKLGALASGVLYLDEEGHLIESKGFKNPKDFYNQQDLMEFSINEDGKDTTMLVRIKEGGYLYVFYPKKYVSSRFYINLNQTLGGKSWVIILLMLVVLVSYITLVYLIIRKLSYTIKKTVEILHKKEKERKDLIFRGLAHDIKTPLAGILGYSKALKDGLASKDKVSPYQEGIYRNALILKDRVEELKTLADFNSEKLDLENKDILEAVRRYIGDNYLWFVEKRVDIEIGFDDGEVFITDFDPNFFDRLLQNILQNSVYHNDEGVQIFIDFDKKKRTLIFKDSGSGIPKNIQTNMYEPMVTANSSRTGDKFRGLGLANVKRIVDLHGWTLEYKEGFYLTF